MEYRIEERTVTLMITGELDHHTLRDISRELGQIIDIYLPKRLVFDMSAVRFMDSSGIGIIMGRYRKIACFGGQIYAIHADRQIRRIIGISGLKKVLHIIEEDGHGQSEQ